MKKKRKIVSKTNPAKSGNNKENPNGKVKTSVSLRPQTIKNMKISSIQLGISFSEFIEQAIEEKCRELGTWEIG